MAVDTERLHAFLGKAVGDLGAAISASLILIGDELGFYKALAAGPLAAAELAKRTGTAERYVREWLGNQAAGGYVEYDATNDKYGLNEEQALCLADPNGPADLPGAYELVEAVFHAKSRTLEHFRNGEGMEWGEHHPCLFRGCERFFRGGYNANLVGSWLPALDGVMDKLGKGGRAADIGCGHGASTVLMAKSFPHSSFVGYDYHAPSIDVARDRAKAAGVANASFEVADATSYPGRDYDLITFFDCLHDMGDPVGAASHIRRIIADNGTWMIVEPFANDQMKDNLNPLGRAYYGFSTLLCTPCSRSQEVGMCLGAQAGEAKIRDIVTAAGFTRFRRAAETPFNIVYEARP